MQPYLQLVTEDARDSFTALPLGDIWRYFRGTWSIPNLPVPGRSMLYLVRDAAHPSHAVMGLIALNNAPMRKRALDQWAGWTPALIRADAEARRQSGTPLAPLIDNCLAALRAAISAICLDGLATPEEIAKPDVQLARRLLEEGDRFHALREKVLKSVARQNRDGVAPRVRQAPPDVAALDLPPLADHLPDLEKTPDPASRLARRLLVAKKRAHELSRHLQAQITLSTHREHLADPARAAEAWMREDVLSALAVVCAAMKSARLSSNLLEITTCGAVPPYQHLLGGKLAALLCFSPRLGADYQARYGGEPAIIRSHMANAPAPADCRLVALITTSLYGVGASQYERVRLPAGIIAPDQPGLRVRLIGESSGFGTVHFSPETMSDIEEVLLAERDFRDVNSVFGEGPSPKLRKLRTGLDLLGFSADDLLQHHQTRLVYALEYWPGATEFLRWGGGETPAWVAQPECFTDATARIADFWRRRWLAMRLDHAGSWGKLTAAEPWRLSDKLPIARATAKHPPAPAIVAETPPPPFSRAATSVYERLAERRAELYSERLPAEALEQLHVETSLDSFILETLAAGHSLVLTGNAGDGKTHLFRRLQSRLPEGLEVIEDATAEMTDARPEPVLDRIGRALAAGRRFVLCANEHQLLLLRETAIDRGPDRLAEAFRSIDEQCRHRLVHGPVNAETEAARGGVVVLDLSLRNPLESGFAGRLLAKLLDDPQVRARAAADERVGRNHRRLAHPQVRERLLETFDRLVLRGQRATVRQLWMILARAVFAPDHEGAGDAPPSWYSEQIFDTKGRLEIDKLLRRFADPAAHSHPRWDWHLIEAPEFAAADWPVDGPPQGINRTAKTHQWFDSLKRRFYFEHRAGAEIYALDAPTARDFRALLREGDSPEPAHVAKLLRGINRLYCPPGFAGDDSALHLWQGLRYHEQPSRAYLAVNSISRSSFRLERPPPPQRVAAAFGAGAEALYAPDHLLLVAQLPQDVTRLLKVDFALFATLEKAADGLPRHLVPEAHIHRVDAFIERIGAKISERGTDFLVFNAEDGTVAKIRTSADHRRIEDAEVIS